MLGSGGKPVWSKGSWNEGSRFDTRRRLHWNWHVTAPLSRWLDGGSLSANPFTVAELGAQAAFTTGGVEALKPKGPVDEAYWQKIRKEFNIVDDMTYMNTGSLGLMPRTVFDAHVRYLREIAEDPRRGRFRVTCASRLRPSWGLIPKRYV